MTAAAIASSAARLADLVVAVPEGALGWATPCSDMTVGDLLDHLATFCGVFTAAAVKDLDAAASPGRPPSRDRLPQNWRIEVPAGLAGLGDAWQEPEAWTGTTVAGGLSTSGALAGAIALDELVVHGWDLARATSQTFEPDPSTLDLVRTFIEDHVGEGRTIPREAVFAPIVATPQGAPLLEGVIGLSGRDPRWRAAH